MEEEILEFLRDNCDCDGTDEEFEEAFNEAENSGYYYNIRSYPNELVVFIHGYILGRANAELRNKLK